MIKPINKDLVSLNTHHENSNQKPHLRSIQQVNPATEIYQKIIENIPRVNYANAMRSNVTTEMIFESKQSNPFLISRNDEDENEPDIPNEDITKIHDYKNKYKVLLVNIINCIAKKIGYPAISINKHHYVWNGKYYSIIDNKDELKKFLKEAGEKSGVLPYIIGNVDFLNKLIDQFTLITAVSKLNRSNNDKILINLLNGTLEITNGSYSLRPHCIMDQLTYVLPFCYESDAKAPVWQKHLEKVLPDQSDQKLMAEHFGSAFIPTSILKLEKMLVLLGSGANGKSVIHDVMSSLLGEQNISQYSLEKLCDEKGQHRAKIGDKLLNYCSEMGLKFKMENLKKLASGEPIEVRPLYKDPYILKDYSKLMFNCNILPHNIEQNEAYFRRLNILRFDVTIPKEEQDKQLAQKIISTELPGVLNWILEGLKRLVSQRDFTVSENAIKQIEEYRKESNPVRLFVDECGYVPCVEGKLPVGELHAAYIRYCQLNHYYPMLANNKFSQRLTDLGFKRTRSQKRSFIHAKQE